MAIAVVKIEPGFSTDASGKPDPAKVANVTTLRIPREWDGDQDIPWARVWGHLATAGKATVSLAVYYEGRTDMFPKTGGNGWEQRGVIALDMAKGPVLLDPWRGATQLAFYRVPATPSDDPTVPVYLTLEAVLHP